MKPNRCVFSPSSNCINKSDLLPHLDITHSHILLSPNLVGSYSLGSLSSSLTRVAEGRISGAELHAEIAEHWPRVKPSPLTAFIGHIFRSLEAAFFGSKIKTFGAVWPALTAGYFDCIFQAEIPISRGSILWHKKWGIWSCLTKVDLALTSGLTADFTAAFDWVWLDCFGLTLTILEGQIGLLLTELLGGHFGATLTNVDFLVKATINCWFWHDCFGQVILIFVLSLSANLLKNNKKNLIKGFSPH